MKILYVGSLEKYGIANTCLHRYQAMTNLNEFVHKINSVPKKESIFKHTFYRVINKLYKYGVKLSLPDIGSSNKKIIEHMHKDKYDVIWIDKGLTINASTLKKVKIINTKLLIVGYSPDDMNNIGNQSYNLNNAYKYYDIYFTTKSYNVIELEAKNIRNVVFIGNAFNENFHKPIKLNENQLNKYKCDIGFIGSYEKERGESIKFLAENGLKVNVWGEGWDKQATHKNMIIVSHNIYEDYPVVLSACKINLCFLRKVNRDLQTTRTMEIPATRSFMIAERTNEHLLLFKESKEAEFFSTNKELLEKCFYYLSNNTKRIKIAKNGYNRCINSGYSNKNRVKFMLQKIKDLRQHEN